MKSHQLVPEQAEHLTMVSEMDAPEEIALQLSLCSSLSDFPVETGSKQDSFRKALLIACLQMTH